MLKFARALLSSLLVGSLALAQANAGEIVISKSKRTLHFEGDGVSRTFRIGLGSAPVGAKQRQGDRRTPEGRYRITHKNPNSQFFLSLGLNYPNLEDGRRGLAAGQINQAQFNQIDRAERRRTQPPQDTALGGDIFIHGRGSASDWTWGCVALDDDDMRFLFEHARAGDQVTILP